MPVSPLLSTHSAIISTVSNLILCHSTSRARDTMQQGLCGNRFATGCGQRQVLSQRQFGANFQPIRGSDKVSGQRRHIATVYATAAPATSASPFAAVDSEAALFGILKAGASAGKVNMENLNYFPWHIDIFLFRCVA